MRPIDMRFAAKERIAKILVQVLIEHQFTTLEASLLHVSQSIALLTMM